MAGWFGFPEHWYCELFGCFGRNRFGFIECARCGKIVVEEGLMERVDGCSEP